MNPAELKGTKTKSQEAQEQRDRDGQCQILGAIKDKPLSARKIRKAIGMGPDRCNRLLYQLTEAGHITETTTEEGGNECTVYSIK